MPKVTRGKAAAAEQGDVQMEAAGAEQASAPAADGAIAPMAVFPPISAGSLLQGKQEWRKVRGRANLYLLPARRSFRPLTGPTLGPAPQIPVPTNRMTPLKEHWMELYTPITENMKVDMRMNLKTKRARTQMNPSNLCRLRARSPANTAPPAPQTRSHILHRVSSDRWSSRQEKGARRARCRSPPTSSTRSS